MYKSRVLIVAATGVLFAAAGATAASSLSSDRQIDFFMNGTHQFYVWCASTNDYVASTIGSSGEDAQMKLYSNLKASGKSCRPIWQGRVADVSSEKFQ
jgi:hypothetical protein